ncbi:hypothetical protein LMG1866_04624 [Achromobacter ruhlandii]|nr:hypothetical protein LMG1866_04624 [Achromobacter ruhlandii]
MEHTHTDTPPQALPGLWREEGGSAGLVHHTSQQHIGALL